VIVRTAAEGATEEALTADVERLVERWRRSRRPRRRRSRSRPSTRSRSSSSRSSATSSAPTSCAASSTTTTLHGQVREYLDEVAPELVDRVELYGAPTDDERSQAAGRPVARRRRGGGARREEAGTTPATRPTPAERREDLPDLFAAFDVTDQLRQAMNRKVWLPSGGYLIIESTEAMKVIDVNTGRFTGGSDSNLEEIVLKTNLEAADEIVRQLRLRDMGGMIIIDFIDMLLRSNQEQVVRRLKRELLRDRTKTRVSDVSRLGLVQMTRKNVSQGLVESFSTKCEACDGHGFVTNLCEHERSMRRRGGRHEHRDEGDIAAGGRRRRRAARRAPSWVALGLDERIELLEELARSILEAAEGWTTPRRRRRASGATARRWRRTGGRASSRPCAT
jgi:ribonuclease E